MSLPTFRQMFFLTFLCVCVAQSVTFAAAANEQKLLLFVGDSLTAGFGVKKEEAFPDRVGELLKAAGLDVKIVNGGISGSVSAEADRRVRWFLNLKPKPQVLVLALGANDGLKGTPPAQIKKNLAQAIDLASANGLKVVLCGIKIFTNFGPDYTAGFEKVYAELAREKKVELVPFLLEGVALKKELNLADGKHPNAKGHEMIAKHLAPVLARVLEKKR